MTTKKKTHEGDIEPGTPNSPEAPANIGTGGPTPPAGSPDPNQDMARADARVTYDRKVAAGEDPGEEPEAPEAMSNQTSTGPTGPVPEGKKRVRIVESIYAGGKMYQPGDIADLTDEDVASVGEKVEPYKKSKS